jgi:TatD DNase family protein
MHAERQTQISVFRRQMDLAQRHRLPVIIHMRDAEQDTLQVLRQSPRLPLAGVMHCFGGDWQTACQCMDLDFFISFAGNVTFKKAVELQEVARKIPADRLLVETDSPYLSPEPVRGRRNEPAHVRYVVQFLAQLRGEPCQSLEETTSRNYLRLFRRRNE